MQFDNILFFHIKYNKNLYLNRLFFLLFFQYESCHEESNIRHEEIFHQKNKMFRISLNNTLFICNKGTSNSDDNIVNYIFTNKIYYV